MRRRIAALVVGGWLCAFASAAGQVAWDSPMLTPPRPQMGLGLFLVEPAFGDIGVLGVWRSAGTPGAFGLRFGIAEDGADDVAGFGGIDLVGPIARETAEFPLDVSWVLGAGASLGDALLLSFPAGLTVGHTFAADGVRFVPYLTPRVVLDALLGDDDPPGRDDDDLELDFAVDIGLDLAFQPGWLIRFGGTLGDREAVAIGIVF